MSKRIGLIVAMDSEYRLTAGLLDAAEEISDGVFKASKGRVGENEVIVAKSGIGKVSAAVGAVEMIRRFSPDCIINSGVGGGIDPEVKVMDIVVSTSVVYHDVWCGPNNAYGQVEGMPPVFPCDAGLIERFKAEKMPALYGMICCGDKFISEPGELKCIKAEFPEGLAVDMESAAIAHVAYLYGCPFVAIRIISDTPGIENNYAQYEDFWTLAPRKSFRIIETFLKII